MIRLSRRLGAVASLVDEGSSIADIGTDHGYLPVYLVACGKIKKAVASDVNSSPLSSCRALVRREGLEDKIKLCLSDGLDSISASEYDTVIIAGMGGELIAGILSRCDELKDKHIILNPMTHPEFARKFLYDNGFEIINDLIVRDGRHSYSVFDARYSPPVKERSKADYFLGNIQDFSDKRYFSSLLNYLENKSKSGEDLSEVICAVKEKLYADS